ncbi:DUF2577 domain-containing protein [Paenibacillus flagellatus]|uniref:DUF2577 domain-containing protein n=1 Tax=Paenibacillus flagellatus TaxID=2211139 RepID=A0A2V5L2R3_9BACL|nr:DUF2577 domain-containing protein [Paenibacillus flagellatus]PYI57016.1 hypothetical protein DLM86_00780 [Paenibacillus flagellatus]
MKRLVEAIKQAGVGAVDATRPVIVQYGTVTKTNPLEVNVDQRLTLPEDFLIVPEELTEYKVTVSTTSGPQEIVIRKALAVGEGVALLRVQGGTQYFILGRVGT